MLPLSLHNIERDAELSCLHNIDHDAELSCLHNIERDAELSCLHTIECDAELSCLHNIEHDAESCVVSQLKPVTLTLVSWVYPIEQIPTKFALMKMAVSKQLQSRKALEQTESGASAACVCVA